MTQLRTELAQVVDALLADLPRGAAVSVDTLGEAIGARAVSTDEIELMITRIERRGHSVSAPQGGTGEAHLRSVVTAARELSGELKRKPTSSEVAERAGLSSDQVKQALMLLTIMQR